MPAHIQSSHSIPTCGSSPKMAENLYALRRVKADLESSTIYTLYKADGREEGIDGTALMPSFLSAYGSSKQIETSHGTMK